MFPLSSFLALQHKLLYKVIQIFPDNHSVLSSFCMGGFDHGVNCTLIERVVVVESADGVKIWEVANVEKRTISWGEELGDCL